eukprot:TRINITY_DN6607_c0_g1_i1.p1 TRINITY_DN6607_c0_g1~~TRINITY_DN6607_c0_g1_i1.p1  ORF type:complete len:189 (-),score=47.72 TRINITY_DN6607_c0_g1_i1:12-578(-)
MIIFGVVYSRSALMFLYGERWAGDATVEGLRVYCGYVFIMGVNGISEAFLYATIPKDKLPLLNVLVITKSILYIALCLLLLPYGVVGLILANILSMTFRIIVAFVYIRNTFDRNFFKFFIKTLPNPIAVVAGVASYFLCKRLLLYTKTPFFDLAAGGVVFLANAALNAFINRREVIEFIRAIRRPKQD